MSFYPTEKNVGGWDRLLRLIVGPVLLIVSAAAVLGVIALPLVLTALSVVVGAILTVTGLTQKCPLNTLIGMNTFRGRTTSERKTERDAVERPVK